MAQFARPDADQATGGWATTPLWSKVNEGATGDDVVITSANNTSPDNADLRLSDVTDPSVSTGHIIQAAWNKDASGGHVIDAVTELWQGIPDTGSLIATLSVTGIGATEQTDTYTLNGTETDNITDYTDLYLRVSRQGDKGGPGGNRRSLVADFVELKVPNAGAQTFTETHAMTAIGIVGLTKQVGKTLPFTATGSPALARTIFLTRPITATGIAGFSQAFLFTQTATAVATGVVSLARSIGLTFAAVATGTASLARTISLTFPVTATGTAALARNIGLTLSATATGVVGFAQGLLFTQAPSMTATGVVGFAQQAVVGITGTMTAVGTAGFSRVATFFRGGAMTAGGSAALARTISVTKAVTAAGTAGMARLVGVTKAVSASGTAGLQKVATFARTAGSTAIGVVAFSKQFMAGGGGPVIKKIKRTALLMVGRLMS